MFSITNTCSYGKNRTFFVSDWRECPRACVINKLVHFNLGGHITTMYPQIVNQISARLLEDKDIKVTEGFQHWMFGKTPAVYDIVVSEGVMDRMARDTNWLPRKHVMYAGALSSLRNLANVRVQIACPFKVGKVLPRFFLGCVNVNSQGDIFIRDRGFSGENVKNILEPAKMLASIESIDELNHLVPHTKLAQYCADCPHTHYCKGEQA